MPPSLFCRHCRRPLHWTRRGLCRRCYQDPAIRARYPCNSAEHGHRGRGLTEGRPRLPEPTTSQPGTEARLAEYARRVRLGLPLHVPGDAELRE